MHAPRMHFASTEFLIGVLSGVGAGVLAGFFGLGGSFVLVPMLRWFFRLDQYQAQGVTLAAMLLPNGIPAVLQYRRAGVRIQWWLVSTVILGFVSGVGLGAWVAGCVSAGMLRWIFVGFLLFTALRAVVNGSAHACDRVQSSEHSRGNLAVLGWVVGVLAGSASGFLGIGGGMVMIPLMVWWLGLGQHEAQATSLAVMLPPIGLPGVVVYAQNHSLPWVLFCGVALGFMAGGYWGAKGATWLKPNQLHWAFVGLTFTMALVLALA
jgi:uncharacterized protein